MLSLSLCTMEFNFIKYQGTGNDFVLIDNRAEFFPKKDVALIAKICHRRFGVGADGLILLESHMNLDFKMVYFNSDGNESSMCGNGGRCIVHFANSLEIVEGKCSFEAVDGMHHASSDKDFVSLQMNDVKNIQVGEDHVFLDTGSPHHVEIVSELETFDVVSEGRKVRNDIYKKEGSNVNFVKKIEDAVFSVRTYERGVEDETLSCGTGVTAVAIAMFETGQTESKKIVLKTLGGDLQVRFTKEDNVYNNIYLEGPAVQVFKGLWK